MATSSIAASCARATPPWRHGETPSPGSVRDSNSIGTGTGSATGSGLDEMLSHTSCGGSLSPGAAVAVHETPDDVEVVATPAPSGSWLTRYQSLGLVMVTVSIVAVRSKTW